MALSPGSRLGSYEVLSPLGVGGMGEVYRARDTKLHREVAIKVLPEEFANDADRLARFTREAHVLASLNHPNIAAIYGIEERAIVMELVDGEDLSQHIARGPIPLSEALPIARQIVDALAAAHEAGVVHRDLKPANVKVRDDGTVKVLDFGLARTQESAAGTQNTSNSPTLTARATQMGMIMGTAAYMAPEQARGRAVDKRADIWAFGVVLYEMLTGRRLFDGEDLTEVLASVVKEQPNLSAAPPQVQRLLKRCLEKDPKRRLRDIGDALELIDEGAAAAPVVVERRRSSLLPWAVAGAAVIAAAVVSALHFSESSATPVTTRFEVPWPKRSSAVSGGAFFFELSPDGRALALVSDGYLWVRSFDAVEPVRLERTQGATYPFWSANGESIAFFAGGQLRAVSRDGTTVRTICDAPEGRGGAWNRDGVIVFAGDSGRNGLWRVTEQGGTPASLTKVDASGSDAHRYPQFLPDHQRFLFLYLTGDVKVAGVYVGSLDGTPPVRVLEGSDSALFAPAPGSATSGHLLFRRNEVLMAQAFDTGSLKVSGPVSPVAADVGQGENTGLGAFSVAANGTLAHWAEGESARELVWMSRSGVRERVVVEGVTSVSDFALSWNESRLAFTRPQLEGGAETQIWVQPLGAGAPTRFTFGPRPGWMAATWSPSGDQIAYVTSDSAGLAAYELYRKPVNMSAAIKLLQSDQTLWLWDWSPDGKTLVYASGGELWLLAVEGDGKPVLVSKTPAEDQYAQFSPDGKWLAYSSGPRDNTEVFVQPLPVSGALWQISQGGGDMPRWRRDGKELFYRARDGRLTGVTYTTTSSAFEAGARTTLFEVASLGNIERFAYQPSRDGQRFLVNTMTSGLAPPVDVVLNWQGGIKK